MCSINNFFFFFLLNYDLKFNKTFLQAEYNNSFQFLSPIEMRYNYHFSLLSLCYRGVKDVLRKRLKNYYKKQKLTHILSKDSCETDAYYDYICIIDFEATCEDGNAADYVHEIIEFPIVLLNTRTLEIVSLTHF